MKRAAHSPKPKAGASMPCQCTRGKWSAVEKLQRLRQRLGGSTNLTMPFPERPKRMRYATYDKLREEARGLEAAVVAAFE